VLQTKKHSIKIQLTPLPLSKTKFKGKKNQIKECYNDCCIKLLINNTQHDLNSFHSIKTLFEGQQAYSL
jgi:hypothetical protein